MVDALAIAYGKDHYVLPRFSLNAPSPASVNLNSQKFSTGHGFKPQQKLCHTSFLKASPKIYDVQKNRQICTTSLHASDKMCCHYAKA